MCILPESEGWLERFKLTDKGNSDWHLFGRTPLFELLIGTVIVVAHTLIAPKPRIASDALFLEGVTLSVIGAVLACVVSRDLALHSLGKARNEAGAHQHDSIKRGSLRSLLKRKTGYRILFIGLILVGAAVVIGELLVRPAG